MMRPTFLVAPAAVFLLASCTNAYTGTYSAPKEFVGTEAGAWKRTLDKSSDEVWTALIEYAASAFYSIETYERDSGLMTLSFGATGIADFVDGGEIEVYKYVSGKKKSNGRMRETGKRELLYQGNYANYLELYQKGELAGRMNIVVRSLSEEQTEIAVRARYIVLSEQTVVYQQKYYQFENKWVFDTGGRDTTIVEGPNEIEDRVRSFQPTHVAESTILDGVEGLLRDG